MHAAKALGIVDHGFTLPTLREPFTPSGWRTTGLIAAVRNGFEPQSFDPIDWK
jgi:hypothetical protein